MRRLRPTAAGLSFSAPAWPLSMALWYVALPALQSALAATTAEVLSGSAAHQMSFPPVTCHRPAAHPACRSILDLCIFNVRDERSFAGIAPQRPARICLKIRCNYLVMCRFARLGWLPVTQTQEFQASFRKLSEHWKAGIPDRP